MSDGYCPDCLLHQAVRECQANMAAALAHGRDWLAVKWEAAAKQLADVIAETESVDEATR